LVRHPGSGGHGHAREGSSLREAVWIIVVADAVMSLDNVLAVAAAAHGDLLLVAFGIALSLPLVVWGSGLLARLMTRFPWIVWLGGGILGYVAGEMMVQDAVVGRWLGHWRRFAMAWPGVAGLRIGLHALRACGRSLTGVGDRAGAFCRGPWAPRRWRGSVDGRPPSTDSVDQGVARGAVHEGRLGRIHGEPGERPGREPESGEAADVLVEEARAEE